MSLQRPPGSRDVDDLTDRLRDEAVLGRGEQQCAQRLACVHPVGGAVGQRGQQHDGGVLRDRRLVGAGEWLRAELPALQALGSVCPVVDSLLRQPISAVLLLRAVPHPSGQLVGVARDSQQRLLGAADQHFDLEELVSLDNPEHSKLTLRGDPQLLQHGCWHSVVGEAPPGGVPVQDRDSCRHLGIGRRSPVRDAQLRHVVREAVTGEQGDLDVHCEGTCRHLQVVDRGTAGQQQLATVRVEHGQLARAVPLQQQAVRGRDELPRLGVVDARSARRHEDQVLHLPRSEGVRSTQGLSSRWSISHVGALP